MRITYNEKILNHEEEWLLESSQYGFVILAKNNKNFLTMQSMTATAMTINFDIEEYSIFFNITEIHNRCNSIYGELSNQIAFKSNIHSKGLTSNINQFDKFYIYNDDKIHKSFNANEKEKKINLLEKSNWEKL